MTPAMPVGLCPSQMPIPLARPVAGGRHSALPLHLWQGCRGSTAPQDTGFSLANHVGTWRTSHSCLRACPHSHRLSRHGVRDGWREDKICSSVRTRHTCKKIIYFRNPSPLIFKPICYNIEKIHIGFWLCISPLTQGCSRSGSLSLTWLTSSAWDFCKMGRIQCKLQFQVYQY